MKRRRLLLLFTLVAALLVGGCGLWVWQAKRQYALNRQLIAALVNRDTKQALALVNVGADPDARCNPPPVPTVNLLLSQLLRRSPGPADSSPTAFLLACGKEYEVVTKSHRRWTVCPQDPQLVQVMLAHGADNKATDTKKQTALHDAASCNHLEVAQLLLQHGANVNAQDISGCTPLMQAAMLDHTDMTRLLLQHGANASAENERGDTALYYAADSDVSIPLFRLLLAQGADPKHRDRDGVTPLSVAEDRCRPEVVALLRKGAK